MAKDPAFLFYPNDWLGGTMALSRFQKGCYIDLLVAQFNNGPLSLDTIKAVLGQDQATWTVLSKKFKQTAEGLWFNERLEAEKTKRIKYSDSRRKNKEGTKKVTHDITYDKHMSPHMENANENRNEVLDEFIKYKIEECLMIALRDSRFVKANKTNDQELHSFNNYLEQQGKYLMNPLDYKTYFAKLKGKFPAMLKRELTVEELREIAKQMDKNDSTSGI